MLMLVQSGHIVCPACDLTLSKIGQQDDRVHIMRHPSTAFCSASSKLLRVDRFNGNAELINNA